MRVLVAGGAGFLGSETAKYLSSRGYDVAVLDPLADRLNEKNISIFKGKLADIDVLKSIGRVDYIVHAAWDFTEDVKKSIEENLIGTEVLCRWASELRVKKLVFYSSSVIYGTPLQIPINEEHPLLIEKSRAPLHAMVKLYVEKLLLYSYYQMGLPVTIFRFWWSFNDERAPGKTYREILAKIKRGEDVTVPFDSGGSVVYAQDLAAATERAFTSEKSSGEIFNISSFYLEWKKILREIAERYGSKSEIIEEGSEWKGPGFLEGKWLLDISKLKDSIKIEFDSQDREKRFVDISLEMMKNL